MKKLSGHAAITWTNDGLKYDDLIEVCVATSDYLVIEYRVNGDAGEDTCAEANDNCSVGEQKFPVLIDDRD
jgi:hypothetical protein